MEFKKNIECEIIFFNNYVNQDEQRFMSKICSIGQKHFITPSLARAHYITHFDKDQYEKYPCERDLIKNNN